MSDWYYGIDDQRFGPVDTATLKQLARSGRLGQEDMVWKEGLKDWVPARKVQGLFKASGPPLMPVPVEVRASVISPSHIHSTPSVQGVDRTYAELNWYNRATSWYSLLGASLIFCLGPLILILALPFLGIDVYERTADGGARRISSAMKIAMIVVLLVVWLLAFFMLMETQQGGR